MYRYGETRGIPKDGKRERCWTSAARDRLARSSEFESRTTLVVAVVVVVVVWLGLYSVDPVPAWERFFLARVYVCAKKEMEGLGEVLLQQ